VIVPLYEYYCSECRSKFELLVSYEASEAEDIVCTRCHGGQVRKLISMFARPRAVAAGEVYGDYDYAEGGDDDYGASCSCGGSGCGCHD
jgi:putative FmdB family regulatory protein